MRTKKVTLEAALSLTKTMTTKAIGGQMTTTKRRQRHQIQQQ